MATSENKKIIFSMYFLFSFLGLSLKYLGGGAKMAQE